MENSFFQENKNKHEYKIFKVLFFFKTYYLKLKSFFFTRLYLGFEFVVLFIFIPLLIFTSKKIIHPSIFLLPAVVFIIIYLYKNGYFKFKELLKINISKSIVKTNIYIVIITSLLLTLIVYIFENNNFMNLPKRNFMIWIILCIFYPVFSAFMQEIVYRLFLFKRYKTLFKKDWILIIACAFVFSFVHIFYFNVISIILTFILGLYLAYLYSKTSSILLTSIIHGFYGDLIFTIGLGQYFWLDMYKFL